MSLLLPALFLLTAHFTFGYIQKQPDFIHRCTSKNSDFGTCSRDAVQGIFNKFKTGYSEAGIPPLDPLKIAEIRLLEGGDGPVSINATLRDATIEGFKDIIITSNKVDLETYSFVTTMSFPRLLITGTYQLKGRILLLPLAGHGAAAFEPKNMNVEVTHTIKLVKRKGVIFFQVEGVKVNFTMTGLRSRLDNLYNGLRALEDSTNEYLNANWRPVVETLKPVLSRTIEDLLIVILRKLFDNVPADFFLTDIDETKVVHAT